MVKLSKDIYTAIVLLVVSVVMFVASNNIVKVTVSKIGADFVPKLVAGGIFILSIVYLVNSSKQLKQQKSNGREVVEKKEELHQS